MENVEAVRSDLGLGEGVSPVEFFLWLIPGAFILVGPFVAYYKLQNAINEVWHELDAADEGPGTGMETASPEQATA